MFDKEQLIRKVGDGEKKLDFTLYGAYGPVLTELINGLTPGGKVLPIDRRKIVYVYTKKNLILNDRDDTVFEIYDLSTRTKLWSLVVEIPSAPMTITENNTLVIVEKKEGLLSVDVISVRDCDTGKVLFQLSTEKAPSKFKLTFRKNKEPNASYTNEINCLTTLSDGRLVSGDKKGCITFWDLDKRQKINVVNHHKEAVKFLVALPDNKLLSCAPCINFTQDDGGGFSLWDLATQKVSVKNNLFKSIHARMDVDANCYGSSLENVFLLSNGLLACVTYNKVFFHDSISFEYKKYFDRENSTGQIIPLPNGLLLTCNNLKFASLMPEIKIWDSSAADGKYSKPASMAKLTQLSAVNQEIFVVNGNCICQYQLRRALSFKDVASVLKNLKKKNTLRKINVSGIRMNENEREKLFKYLTSTCNALEVINLQNTGFEIHEVERLHQHFSQQGRVVKIIHEKWVAQMQRGSERDAFFPSQVILSSEEEFINYKIAQLRLAEGKPTRAHLNKDQLAELDSEQAIILKAMRSRLI